MKHLLLILISVALFSCAKKVTNGSNVQPETTKTNTQIISCPVVEKPFIKKNGVPTGHSEYYLQRSIQDYFIKFCESSITQEELQKALLKQQGLIKALKLEIELKDGEWDSCPDDDGQVQSRIGKYAVIHKIIE